MHTCPNSTPFFLSLLAVLFLFFIKPAVIMAAEQKSTVAVDVKKDVAYFSHSFV